MPAVFPNATPTSIDEPAMRHAGRELLSLALMDARNHTLHLLSHFEPLLHEAGSLPPRPGVESPLWLAGHIGWLAEYWIGRNPQRALGPACPHDVVRLAFYRAAGGRLVRSGIGAIRRRAGNWSCRASRRVRAYLLETLESTLELLDKSEDTDAGLYFYRVALFHEDLRCEQLVAMAQALGCRLKLALPVGSGATRCRAGSGGSLAAGVRAPGLRLRRRAAGARRGVPEFEIDAQPVNWAQYVEFVEDGGYDRPELWQPAGWAWLEREAAPGWAARAALCRTDRRGQRRRPAGPFRPACAHGRQPERHARELVGGRRLGPVGRPAAAHRGRMGDGHACRRPARFPLGRRARMDGEHAATLARVPAGCVEPSQRSRGAAAVRARPRAARRVFRRALAHEASEVPRLCPAGARRRIRRVSDLQL